MIQIDLPSLLKLAAGTPDPAVIAATPEPSQKLPELTIGQRLVAKVGASLPDGGFKVFVAGQAFQMRLPQGLKAGDQVELIFAGANPRPTFVLPGPPGGPETPLSVAGRFIAMLAREPDVKSGVSAAARSAPLLPGPPVNAKELGNLLADTLAKSGLFYESHQAQWLAGTRPLEALLQEPQGRLSAVALPSAPAANTAAASPPGNVAEAGPDSVAPADARRGEIVAEPQLWQQVQQQLDALANSQVLWRGEVWPGQWVEWEVTEREASPHGREADGSWQTRLHFQFPRLGEVIALLRFGPAGMIIELAAARSGSAEILHAHSADLSRQLEGAGVRVLDLRVSADG